MGKMKICVTVKHIGIKKLLIPALAKIKDIEIDVLLHNESGLIPEDNYKSLNIHVIENLPQITYPQTLTMTFKESLSQAGINLDSYDTFLMAGLCSTPHLLREFKGKIIIYTVAPFYRAMIPPDVLQAGMAGRGGENTTVIHSTPTHFKEYEHRYEKHHIKNSKLLAHGLNPDAWGKWNGERKEVLTIWGGYKKRVRGKHAYFGKEKELIKGHHMIKKILDGEKHHVGIPLSEPDMRQALRDFRVNMFFMKDAQTIGLVETLRAGTPLVMPENVPDDIHLFLKHKENVITTDNGDELRDTIKRLMKDNEFAKKLSQNERDTSDDCFNFNRYVMNWNRLLKADDLRKVSIEQPKAYRKFK